MYRYVYPQQEEDEKIAMLDKAAAEAIVISLPVLCTSSHHLANCEPFFPYRRVTAFDWLLQTATTVLAS